MQKFLLLLIIALPVSLFAQKPTAPAAKKPAAKPTTTAPASKPPTTTSGTKPSGPLPTSANAAPVKKDSAILKLFEKPTEVKWVKYFKGRIDDATVVDITLGFDGRSCRGFLVYSKSRIRFNLSGTLDTSGLLLEERDLAKGITGQLKGTLKTSI